MNLRKNCLKIGYAIGILTKPGVLIKDYGGIYIEDDTSKRCHHPTCLPGHSLGGVWFG